MIGGSWRHGFTVSVPLDYKGLFSYALVMEDSKTNSIYVASFGPNTTACSIALRELALLKLKQFNFSSRYSSIKLHVEENIIGNKVIESQLYNPGFIDISVKFTEKPIRVSLSLLYPLFNDFTNLTENKEILNFTAPFSPMEIFELKKLLEFHEDPLILSDKVAIDLQLLACIPFLLHQFYQSDDILCLQSLWIAVEEKIGNKDSFFFIIPLTPGKFPSENWNFVAESSLSLSISESKELKQTNNNIISHNIVKRALQVLGIKLSLNWKILSFIKLSNETISLMENSEINFFQIHNSRWLSKKALLPAKSSKIFILIISFNYSNCFCICIKQKWNSLVNYAAKGLRFLINYRTYLYKIQRYCQG
jgi:hypothetical protein